MRRREARAPGPRVLLGGGRGGDRRPGAPAGPRRRPASQPPSAGRGSPRWSVAGHGRHRAASMAALPAPGSRVGVGPPLAARAPRRGSPGDPGPGSSCGRRAATTFASAAGADRPHAARRRPGSTRPRSRPRLTRSSAREAARTAPTALPLNVENVTDSAGRRATAAPPRRPRASAPFWRNRVAPASPAALPGEGAVARPSRCQPVTAIAPPSPPAPPPRVRDAGRVGAAAARACRRRRCVAETAAVPPTRCDRAARPPGRADAERDVRSPLTTRASAPRPPVGRGRSSSRRPVTLARRSRSRRRPRRAGPRVADRCPGRPSPAELLTNATADEPSPVVLDGAPVGARPGGGRPGR